MKKMETGNNPSHSSFISRHIPEILIFVLVLIVSLYVALSPPNSLMKWYNNDDGFFYFKVAQNIIAGKGVTFDGFNPTNGFHPLWLLICIPVFALAGQNLILPLRLIVIIFGLMQAVSLVLIYQFLAVRLAKVMSFMLTMAFGLTWLVYDNTFAGGLESALSFLLVVILLKTGSNYVQSENKSFRRLIILGVIAGLTVLSRLDNLIFVAFFGVWLVFDRKQDAGFILLDAIASILIVTISAMIRSGYGIYTLQTPILAAIIFLTAGGILSFYLLGFYSQKPVKIFRNRLLGGLLAGGASVITLFAGSYLLFRVGIIDVLPRSILLYSGIAWVLYAVLIRGFLLHRLSPSPFEENPVSGKWFNSSIDWIRKPAAFFVPVLILAGIYMLWSQINFGTPMPVSGQIKHWWGTLGNTIYGSPIHSLGGFREYLFDDGSPFMLLYSFFSPILSRLNFKGATLGLASWVILGASYLILVILRQKKHISDWSNHLAILPFAAATVYRVLYFYISGYVHMRSWYWTIETFFMFLLIILVVAACWEIRPKSVISHGLIAMVTGCVMLFSGVLFIRTGLSMYPWQVSSDHAQDYLIIPRMIEDQTEPGSIIGTPGGGTLSYFVNDRVIVNLDGLMNSKVYFDDLRAFDTHDFMAKTGIRYVYANEYSILTSLPYSSIFKDRLTPVGTVFGKSLFLYK